MRSRAASFALACAIGTSGIGYARPLQWTGPLTLAQAIQRARSSSFDVRMARADAAAAAARAAGARSTLFPQVGVSGTTSNGGITQLGMPYAQQTYVLATATVPIFVPSALEAAVAAGGSARAAGYAAAAERNDAALLATQNYERALLAQAIVDARAIAVNYEQRNVNDVQVRVRVGDAARYRLFESRAALAQARQSLEDACADRDEAIADLEVLLDLAVTPDLRLADPLVPSSLPGDREAITRRALVQRPEILAAREQLATAQAKLAAARAQYLPTVAANAQSYSGRSNPPLGATGYQVGITASLPLIDGGSRPAATHEAQAYVVRAKAALEEAQLSAQRDAANAWREYQAAQRNLSAARTQTVSAREELRLALLRDRAGKGTTLETLVALSDAAIARENLLRAIARLNIAVAAVHHAAGDHFTSRESS
ncbi:MAG: TolC family protein [Candidatus Tyrphobacter sp.]